MVVFAIPLRAKCMAKNWDNCCMRTQRTVDSIYHNTNQNFKIILCGDDKPGFLNEYNYDDRVEFIECKLEKPKTWLEIARNKYWKLLRICVRVRDYILESQDPEKGIYVMPVDDDDLLHKDLVDFLEQYPNENGFYIKDGYVNYGDEKKWLVRYKNIYKFCGSCNCIRLYLKDCPEKMPFDSSLAMTKDVAYALNERYPIRWDHHVLAEKYKKNGKPFKAIKWRAVIYNRNTGENASQVTNWGGKKKNNNHDRFHFGIFIKSLNLLQYKLKSRKIKNNFNLYPIL